LILFFQPDLAWNFFSRPWLKISRQTLIEKWCTSAIFRRKAVPGVQVHVFNFLQPDPDWNFFSRLWLKKFKQTLIEKFSSRSGSRSKTGSGSIRLWLKF
jgi:hypothetical protein